MNSFAVNKVESHRGDESGWMGEVKEPESCNDLCARIRYYAMSLLARREHSKKELQEKVRRKFSAACESELVSVVVEELAEEGLQSDERFVEMFINARINRGYGPRRIIRELQQKGINDALLLDRVEDGSAKWLELVRQVRVKKFGGSDCREPDERARLYRFLQYRGFSMEQIQACERQGLELAAFVS